jgi:acetolactate synthase-1/2/3 large subunit
MPGRLLEVPNPKQRLVHVHSSDREIGKIYAADVPVHAGPNQFAAAVKGLQVDGSWADWCKAARESYLAYVRRTRPARPSGHGGDHGALAR